MVRKDYRCDLEKRRETGPVRREPSGRRKTPDGSCLPAGPAAAAIFRPALDERPRAPRTADGERIPFPVGVFIGATRQQFIDDRPLSHPLA